VHLSRIGALVCAGLSIAACGSAASRNAVSGSPASGSPAGSSAASRPAAAFSWFHATPVPAGWHTIALPDRTAALAYPAIARLVPSDRGSVSAELADPRTGAVLLYLNATPQQGAETRSGWATFRIEHLLEDTSSSATELGHATGLRFTGGVGSCVLDTYVTRVKAHHYEEIACFVQGSRTGSVLIAASAASSWPRFQAVLEQAVAAYRVS
jgi:hypothetical protein